MTCKENCIHFIVCEGVYCFFGKADAETQCKYFKNKADYVEVVRCKDCGSYNKHYGECTLNGSHFGEDGYCCKGTQTQNDKE